MKKKHEVAKNVMDHIQHLKNANKQVKYLRGDNAEEHRELISY